MVGRHVLPSVDVSMSILLGSVFKYVSLPTTFSQSMSQLKENADIWHFDTVASPAELILHDHCIDAGDGLPIRCEAFLRQRDGMSPESSGDTAK